jgi:hypothetical protein
MKGIAKTLLKLFLAMAFAASARMAAADNAHPAAAAPAAAPAITSAPPLAPAANPPLAPAATPPVAPSAPASVTILNDRDVQGILGREVRSTADENMGRIVDVLVDRTGRVRAAVIDFGGFLGVGSRKIAVDWSALHFPPPTQPDARITLDLNRDQVKTAPEFQEGKPVVVLGALGKLDRLPFE